MVGHLDTLDQQDSIFMPLVISAVMHAGLFSLIAIFTYLGMQGRVLWGTPQAISGGAVGIQAVKQLPMPVRTGAANLSAPGLKRQDNDLIVIESAEVAGVFKRAFEERFASGERLLLGGG